MVVPWGQLQECALWISIFLLIIEGFWYKILTKNLKESVMIEFDNDNDYSHFYSSLGAGERRINAWSLTAQQWHKNPSKQEKFSTKGDNTICRGRTDALGKEFHKELWHLRFSASCSSCLHGDTLFRKSIWYTGPLQGPLYILSMLVADLK